MKHAGIHWPANAGGEHPNRQTIYSMPGSSSLILMLADSARFWYTEARQRCEMVVWRGLPRPDRLPSWLGWDTQKVAAECVNLWDEQAAAHTGREWFLPLNELQFPKESGEDWRGYAYMVARLAPLRVELERYFASLGQNVGLMFPAWVPSDDGERLHEWADEARRWDAICVHCYGDAETMRARYQSYRDAFPGMRLLVGEWNSNHEEHDERESLEMWAEVAAADPLFMGATYYIWETRNQGEGDLSILGNSARLALFRDPPVVSQPEPAPVPDPVPEPVMTEYEQFIRDAAQKRGIDPDIAVRVANSEGSVTEPARRGTFDTGSSWWAFQLHYGGPGYEQYGTAAGMGTGFTELTGWQPGDPAAWKDATRYALNRAKLNGWGAWYGAAHVGIGQWDGIDRNTAYYANSETWDYEAGVTPVPPAGLPYNPDAPCDVQPDDFSCSIQSTQWLLRSIGRNPADAWMEQQLVPGIVSKDVGLLDASGEQLAAWINREYGAEMGFEAHAAPVTFDDVLAGAGTNPTIVGGRHYGPGGHWVGIRRHDEDGLLEMANPAPNYTNTGTHLDRDEWAARGPWSAIWIDRGAVAAPPVPVPVPVPGPSRAHVLVDEIRVRLEELANLVA